MGETSTAFRGHTMNGLFPNIVPELSAVLISDRFYNVLFLDAYHWGDVNQIEDDKYSVFMRDKGAFFVGTLEECLDNLMIGVVNV
jgi:hypothetical protein